MLTCCGVQLTWRLLSPTGPDHPLEGAQCPTCQKVHERKKDSQIAYIKSGEEYVCSVCESVIHAVRVAHPIHDGPVPLSGSGRCAYETVPYCPHCEPVPSTSGSFITVTPEAVA